MQTRASVHALAHISKPRFRGVSHFYALFVAVVAAVVLVATAPGGLATFAAAVYATTLVGMFAASVSSTGATGRRDRAPPAPLDHTAIFL
jgi:predicted membrane channel-forming protein YqfA (hemolysin III family)